MEQKNEPQIKIEKDIIPALTNFCQDRQFNKFTLVADRNTYLALGQRVEEALQGQGFDLKTIILEGPEVVADESYLVQVLLHADTEDRVYLAVGSGTITDITRFISHRTKSTFISLPTAPSVDGFVSVSAPLVIAGLKETVLCAPPVAVFADLDTLAAAPKLMIAAGFGDMLGKYTSLADWHLGHLLWDERYDAQVARRTRNALLECVEAVDAIDQATGDGIRTLMDGLLESGMSMIELGSTVPASGSEHHLSHHWEMKLLWEKRPALLHGAKVGVATIIIAGYYAKFRQLTRQQVMDLLEAASLDRTQELASLQAAYPSISERLAATQSAFLDQSSQAYEALKQRIADHWSEVQAIAAEVPEPQVITSLLARAGGPTTPQMLGLSQEDVMEAVRHAHYLRNRFTVLKLGGILNLL